MCVYIYIYILHTSGTSLLAPSRSAPPSTSAPTKTIIIFVSFFFSRTHILGTIYTMFVYCRCTTYAVFFCSILQTRTHNRTQICICAYRAICAYREYAFLKKKKETKKMCCTPEVDKHRICSIPACASIGASDLAPLAAAAICESKRTTS
jgi:hypothetical protein